MIEKARAFIIRSAPLKGCVVKILFKHNIECPNSQ
jgi:hypothetical protein